MKQFVGSPGEEPVPVSEGPAGESLTDAERAGIAGIFERGDTGMGYARFDPSLARELRDFGSKAVAYAAEKIEETASDGKASARYNYVRSICYSATAADEVTVAALLANPIIAEDFDRSGKGALLNVLSRIGSEKSAPFLEKFAHAALHSEYTNDDFHRWDAHEVFATVFYIMNRLEDGDGRLVLERSIDAINDELRGHGIEPFPQRELAEISRDVDGQALLAAHERSFVDEPHLRRGSLPGPDLGYLDWDDDPFNLPGFGYGDPEDDSFLEDASRGDGSRETYEETHERLRGTLDDMERRTAEPFDGRRYEFFEDAIERQELFDYCKKVAEYLHDEGIADLVIIDRSSRPVYIGVKEYWRHAYPGEKSPNMYFMNPNGFRLKSEAGHKGGERDTRGEVEEEFAATYRQLMEDKEKPVLIFDSCIHSGNTLEPVKKTMEGLGFEKLLVGSINPSGPSASVQTDFFITRNRPEKGCYPFDRDRMIEKTLYSVSSNPTTDAEHRARAVRLRLEIKKVMQDKLGEVPATKPGLGDK